MPRVVKLLMILTALNLVLFIQQCHAETPTTECRSIMCSKSELLWQSLHVVDAMQTAKLKDDPYHKEGALITRALIGENPDRAAVATWAVGTALLHAGVSQFLLSRGHTRIFAAWQMVTLVDTGAAVALNFSYGIKP